MRIIALVLAALCLFPPSASALPRDAATIVLITFDDLDTRTFDYLRSRGDLPNLDAIANAGMYFEAFTQATICSTSRAALLTGRGPLRTGVLNNTGPGGGYAAFRAHDGETNSIANRLLHAGWKTIQVGKLMNGDIGHAPSTGPLPGWTDSIVMGPEYYDFMVSENGTEWQESSYHTDFVARNVLDRMRAIRDEPVFVNIGFVAPHSGQHMRPPGSRRFENLAIPFPPQTGVLLDHPPKWLEIEPYKIADEAAYLEAATLHARDRAETLPSVDLAIGQIQDLLHRQWADRGRPYCLIITSDHGFHQVARGDRYGKTTAYDDDSKVPFLFLCEGTSIPAQVPQKHLVLLTDLVPTILDMAGVESEDGAFDGRSMLPYFRDPTLPGRKQFLIVRRFCEENSSEPACRYDAVRTIDGWLSISHHNGDRELYGPGDPFQMRNLSAYASPAILADFEARTKLLAACQGESCRLAEDAAALLN